MALDITEYDTALNDIMREAQRLGEAVEFAVLNTLADAIQTIERVRTGQHGLNDAVRRKIEESLDHGRSMLSSCDAEHREARRLAGCQ